MAEVKAKLVKHWPKCDSGTLSDYHLDPPLRCEGEPGCVAGVASILHGNIGDGPMTCVMPLKNNFNYSYDSRWLLVPEELSDKEALARIGVSLGLETVQRGRVADLAPLGTVTWYSRASGKGVVVIESFIATTVHEELGLESDPVLGEELARVSGRGSEAVRQALAIAGFVADGQDVWVRQDGQDAGEGDSCPAGISNQRSTWEAAE